jgi:hypothetical protein
LSAGTNNFNAVGDPVEIKQYFCVDTAAVFTAGTSSGFMDEIVTGTGTTPPEPRNGRFTHPTREERDAPYPAHRTTQN